MKAQGEMKAIRITWRTALLSGKKAGAIVVPEPPWPIMPATKQNVMPIVKRITRIFMRRAVASLLFMHRRATREMTRIVTIVSPK